MIIAQYQGSTGVRFSEVAKRSTIVAEGMLILKAAIAVRIYPDVTRALVRPMLIGHVSAYFAVVFDGRPDADVDGGEHRLFRNH
jgi:hypothetical protein